MKKLILQLSIMFIVPLPGLLILTLPIFGLATVLKQPNGP